MANTLRSLKFVTAYNTIAFNILDGHKVVAVAHQWPRRGDEPSHFKASHNGHHFERRTLDDIITAVALQRSA